MKWRGKKLDQNAVLYFAKERTSKGGKKKKEKGSWLSVKVLKSDKQQRCTETNEHQQ